MPPVIPKYQREQLRVPDAIAKQGGAANKAMAQGQQKVAGALGNLAQGHAQTANLESRAMSMEINNLSNRLNEFNTQLNNTMGRVATKFATDSANKSFMDNKAQITKIKQDPSLSDQERFAKISEVETSFTNDNMSVYGRAYDSVATANYNNQIVITAAEVAMQAEEAANGDATKFKEIFNKYTQTALNGAPTPATKVVASRSFDKAGLVTFKSIHKKNKAKLDKEAKYTSNMAYEQLVRQFIGQNLRGEELEAKETETAIVANRNSAAGAGFILNAKALDDVTSLQPLVQQAKISTEFDAAFKEGNGVDVLKDAETLYQEGLLDGWKPGVYDSMKNNMLSTLKDRGNSLADDVTSLLTEGKSPTPELMKELETYQPYLSDTKNKALLKAEKEYKILNHMDEQGMSLIEKAVLLDKEIAKEEQDPVVYPSLVGAKETVKKHLLEAKKDPITLGAQDNKFILQPLNPTELDVDMVKERYTQSTTAKDAYGTQRQFFTQDEVATFKAYVENPATSVDEKLDLMTKIEEGTGGRSDAAFNQLSKDGASVFTGAASVALEGKTTVARNILQGEMLKKEGKMVTEYSTIKATTISELGSFLKFAGTGDADKIAKTVESLAIYHAARDGGEVMDIHVEDAIKYIMGDSSEYGDRDHKFFAPPGVEADDVVTYFDNIEEGSIPPMRGITPGYEVNAIYRSDLVYAGDGEYVFMHEGTTLLTNEDGTVYRIKYTK